MSEHPVLKTFRVVAYSSENRAESSPDPWEMNVDNTIEIGMAVPTVAGNPIQAWVKLGLRATAKSSKNSQAKASFSGEYQATFDYPASTTESEVSALVATDEHQYLLAAQVFPLAMSHFRRELQSTGFDGRELPLGM
jgi:hypothetical protein